MARVLWYCVHLCGKDEDDVRAGRAIFGSREAGAEGPARVCLACQPGWGDLNRLALEEYEWQLAKENAVATGDFGRAGELLRMQRARKPELTALVKKLLNDQAPEP
jgi:hypothetical protein